MWSVQVRRGVSSQIHAGETIKSEGISAQEIFIKWKHRSREGIFLNVKL